MRLLMEFLDRQSRRTLWCLAVALIALVTLADFLSGPRISLVVFYLPAIVLGSWYLRPRGGRVFALLSVLGWLATVLGVSVQGCQTRAGGG